MMKFPDSETAQTLEAMPDAIVAVDSGGEIRFLNSVAEELTGYSIDELVGQRVDVLVPRSRQKTHARQRSQYHAAPTSRQMGARADLQLRHKSGMLIPVEISLSPLAGADDGIVLTTVRDVSAEERRSREVILLSEIGRIVNSDRDIRNIYQAVADQIPALIAFDRLVITLKQPDTDLVRRVFVSGIQVEGGEEETNISAAADSGAAPGPDPYTSLAGRPVPDTPVAVAMAALGLNSWAEVPLGNPDEPFGYLSLRSTAEDAYDDEDLRVLERIAAQISPAIENARLYAQARAEARERTVLAEVSRIMASTADLGSVYGILTAQIRELVPFDRITVSAIDRDRNLVTDRYVFGLHVEGAEAGGTRPLDRSLTGRLMSDPGPHCFSGDQIDEIVKDFPFQGSRTNAGLKSLLTVPLIWNDEAIGMIFLRSSARDAYGAVEATNAMKIANQIAGAVANAELVIKLRSEGEERAVLAEISRIITSTSDIEKVYSLVADQIRKLVSFDRIVLLNIDRVRDLVTVRHMAGVMIEGEGGVITHPLSDLLALDIIVDRQPRWFSHTELVELMNQNPRVRARFQVGLNSLVTVPLIWDDEVIGLLVLHSRDEDAYSEVDAVIAMKIANQISGAVANAELVARLRAEGDEKAVLAEISRIITSTSDIEKVYDLMVDQIRKLVPFDRIVVATFDRSRKLVTDRYVAGLPVDRGEAGVTYPLSNSSSGELLKDLVPRWFTKHEIRALAKRYPADQSRIRAGLNSLLTVPLIWNDECIGRLVLRSRDECEYGKVEAALAMKIANQISGAVANAELVARLRREGEERAVLAEISRAVSSGLDLDGIYQTVAEEVTRLMSYDRMAIMSIDREHSRLHREFISGLDIEGAGVGTADDIPRDVPGFGIDDLGPATGVYTPEIIRKLGIRYLGLNSYMRAPLMIGADRFGYLNLEHASDDAFSEENLALLERIAGVIAPAIENAKLYEAARRESAERASLAEIGRIVTSDANIGRVYDEFTQCARRLIPCDRVIIAVLDDRRENIVDRYVGGVNLPGVRAGRSNPFAGSAAEELIAGTLPRRLDRVELEDWSKRHPELIPGVRSGSQSLLFAALTWNGVTNGLLIIGALKANAFDDSHCELAVRIADQISGAISNARSHEAALKAENERVASAARERELENLNEARSNFLSTVSHELKTPLTSLIAFADLLGRNSGANLSDRQMQQIEVLRRSARRLDVLINDLLDVSRLDAGTFRLVKQEFDVEVLLREISEAFAPIVLQKHQTLEVEPGDHHIWLTGDRDRIAQVISNLLSNAAKYSGEESVITLTAVAELGNLAITVEDSGIGMSEEDQRNLFTPFFRAANEATQAEIGSGLGLVIVKSIVELHGGDVSLESAPGRGTRVSVTFPGYRDEPSSAYLEALQIAAKPVAPHSRLDEVPTMPAAGARSDL